MKFWALHLSQGHPYPLIPIFSYHYEDTGYDKFKPHKSPLGHELLTNIFAVKDFSEYRGPYLYDKATLETLLKDWMAKDGYVFTTGRQFKYMPKDERCEEEKRDDQEWARYKGRGVALIGGEGREQNHITFHMPGLYVGMQNFQRGSDAKTSPAMLHGMSYPSFWISRGKAHPKHI